MDTKEAIKLAKEHVMDMFADEGIYNLGLEEVSFNEADKIWNVTLGFSRPWNTARNAFTALTGEEAPKRSYKIIRISDADKKIVSLNREDSK